MSALLTTKTIHPRYQLDGYLNGGTAPWMDSTMRYAAGYAIGTGSGSGSGLAPAVTSQSVEPAPDWLARGVQAYTGLNRTDPQAVWSFQGFAFVGWHTAAQASALDGFVQAVPQDHFSVIDMGYTGSGEWRKWNDSSFFGAPSQWTTLMNFGGTNGIKGNLTHMNEIPFQVPAPGSRPPGHTIHARSADSTPTP